MARKLREITQKINGHLALRFGVLEDQPSCTATAPSQDHPAIRSAFLQGEAVLVQGFFEFCEKKGIRDPESQMKIWDRLVARQNMAVELCERSNLNKYSRRLLPQKEGQPYKERCHRLFCLYLWDLGSSAGGDFVEDVFTLYANMVLTE